VAHHTPVGSHLHHVNHMSAAGLPLSVPIVGGAHVLMPGTPVVEEAGLTSYNPVSTMAVHSGPVAHYSDGSFHPSSMLRYSK